MSKYKKSKYKIELVEWVDSFGCTSTWSEIQNITTLLVCYTIGFVVSENDNTISLASSVALETVDTKEQANGIMTIPLVCIKKRTPI